MEADNLFVPNNSEPLRRFGWPWKWDSSILNEGIRRLCGCGRWERGNVVSNNHTVSGPFRPGTYTLSWEWIIPPSDGIWLQSNFEDVGETEIHRTNPKYWMMIVDMTKLSCRMGCVALGLCCCLNVGRLVYENFQLAVKETISCDTWYIHIFLLERNTDSQQELGLRLAFVAITLVGKAGTKKRRRNL